MENIVGQVCVCMSCKWIYVVDEVWECENENCKNNGKRGIMCNVIPIEKEHVRGS